MGTITLSLPDELKAKIDKIDWINWSSIARHAFFETLKDVREVELKKRVHEISEIPEHDNKKVKESIVRKVINSVERTLKQSKEPMTSKELDKILGLK